MVARIDLRLVLDGAKMTPREMIDLAVRHGRLVWVGSALSVGALCWIGWRIDRMVGSSPFPVWDNLPLIYTVAAVSAVGALLVRKAAYDRAGALRETFLRDSLAAVPESDRKGPAVLADALMELSIRERSVWTLAAGPTFLALPSSLLSGDASPMWPLAAASFAALVLTFPRREDFARRAGLTEVGTLSFRR